MRSVLLFALVLAALEGCYMGSDTQSLATSSQTTPGAGTITSAPGDLPCDVAQVLQSKCQTCHSNPPTSGAPMPLVSYSDLTAPARSDPTKKEAELCIARMQSTTSPMPPSLAGSPASASDIATMQSWVSAGMPQGSCTGATTALTCSSGIYGQPGAGGDGSGEMAPGEACISCHTHQSGEKMWTLAGTVYPTVHEDTDCTGVLGIDVVVTDPAGQNVVTLSSNAVGNFYSNVAIPAGSHVKVVQGTKERAMSAAPPDGNCNNCHTPTGINGAPGRIMAP